MAIIYITIPLTLIFIAIAIGLFFWATRNGQYDDLDSPAHRILFDETDGIQPKTPQQRHNKSFSSQEPNNDL